MWMEVDELYSFAGVRIMEGLDMLQGFNRVSEFKKTNKLDFIRDEFI